ncbi:efflux RND transporter periplasmic adaptor subunit [Deferribacter abyssi]|uniref:efflux RND transporter periplasmic adaptor subunit n=1 Tax=Deferribacter abyssi TaxID=213806 RepID=UPI003C1AA4D7
MKKILSLIIIILIVAGGVFLIKERKQQLASLQPPPAKTITVETVHPKNMHIEEIRQFLGTYYSIQHPVIASKVSGFIEKLYVVDGEKVKKGQLLVKIDDKEIVESINAQKAAIRALIQSIESLKVNLKALESDFLYARDAYERNKELYKVDALSKEKLDFSRVAMELKLAKLKSTQKSIEAKKEELKSLKAQLLSKENQLKYTSIKSPIDGVVGRVVLRDGDLVVPGKQILTLYGMKKRVEFSFSQNMIGKIKKGKKAYLLGKQAEITKVLPVASKFLAVAYIDLDTTLPLPENSNIKIGVVIKEATGSAVPVNALLEKEDGVYLFVYNGGRFTPTKVQILSQNDKYAVVSPDIDKPVAIGSNDKLSKLFVITNAKAVNNE